MFLEWLVSLQKRPQWDRELLNLADGGQIALDWLVQEDAGVAKKRNIVVLIPGINGD